MQLTPLVFQLDEQEQIRQIVNFIRAKVSELNRDGIVVAISGGVDSSTVAALCVLSVGKEQVTGLMLPEKRGNPEALQYGKILAAAFGIHTETIDLSKVLSALGTYDFILGRISSRGLVDRVVKGLVSAQARKDFFLGGLKGTRNPLVRQGMASMYSKHRLRMVITYLYAEQHNLLVVGSAHKSEDLFGLFSKFGVDDCADVMPLKHLYRSHILQIAHSVGVPGEIIARKPNPDMLPGIEDKYQDVLGIPAEILDLILYGLEHALPAEDIAAQLKISLSQVHEVQELGRLSEHMRNHAYSLHG